MSQSAEYVLASDEAGTGAWAGPFKEVAVLVPRDWRPPDKTGDSKKLTASARERVFMDLSLDVTRAIIQVTSVAIDLSGLNKALIEAHTHAQHQAFLAAGSPASCERIVDGILTIPGARSLPKADSLIPACSAASIIAKVLRDRIMRQYSRDFPGYGFEQHMGYGTDQHKLALETLGPCSIHRRSCDPVRRELERREDQYFADMRKNC